MADASGLTPAQQEVASAVAEALPGGSIVIALSGGGDSAALAWAVSHLGRQARAVSIDHGLPGSARLMDAAAAIARALGFEHTVIPVDAAGTSESALREVRLDALEAEASVDEVVLTAHTADDQAETVIGNLIRGAGPTGISGIPQRRGVFARPMLSVSRATARHAAAQAGLPFVDDPENLDVSIRRNRLRLETIPHLAEAYNPAVVEAVGRAAALATSDDAVLRAMAAKVPVTRDEEAVLVPTGALLALSTAVASRVARTALRRSGGPHAGDAGDVASVLRVAADGGSASLSGDRMATRERGMVAIHPTAPPPAPDPVALSETEPTVFGTWTIRPAAVLGLGSRWATVPAGATSIVRAPESGDRIAIGGGQHKSVADAMSEAAVPRRLRPRWPLVVCDDSVAWIVGVRSAPIKGATMVLTAMRERA